MTVSQFTLWRRWTYDQVSQRNSEEKSKAQKYRKLLPDNFSSGRLFNSLKQMRQCKSQCRTGPGRFAPQRRVLITCNSLIDPWALPPPSQKALHELSMNSPCTTTPDGRQGLLLYHHLLLQSFGQKPLPCSAPLAQDVLELQNGFGGKGP